MKSGIRKTYNFKSVGETREKKKTRAEALLEQFPIGFKTPLSLGDKSDIFDMHESLSNQVSDNFRNMLQTNHGERLGMFDFGANLSPLAFELTSDVGTEDAIRRIKETTSKYMPYIDLQTFESFTEHSDNKEVAKIGIRVTYNIPSIRVNGKILELIIYTAG